MARGNSRLYLIVLSSTTAIIAGLLIACSMVKLEQDRISASTTAPLGSVELLTIQSLMHEPTCAADKHCRSACRMVCDEVHSDTGALNHATTLIAFGCCLSMPVIDKQIPAARTEELLQVSSSKRTMKPAMLSNENSLAADFADLKRQEAAQAKRVAHLGLKSALPYKIAKGSLLAFDPNAPSHKEGTKRVFSDTDPHGVERQAEIIGKHKFHWDGRDCTGEGCPQETKAFKTNQAVGGAVKGTNRYGLAVDFRNATVAYLSTDDRELDRLITETTIAPYGEPYEEKIPRKPSGLWTDNSYRHYLWCVYETGEKEACTKKVVSAHHGWEWRPKKDCKKKKPEDCLEKVAARTERALGPTVGRDVDLTEDMEKELAEQVPTDDAIKKYLGEDLYKEYEHEEKAGRYYGHAHLKVQEGQAVAQQRKAFRDAFGQDSFEWCLHQHRADQDFPRACTGDGPFIKGSFRARDGARTAPQAVLEGVAGAFGNLIGEDHEEHVRDQIQTEKAWGHKQRNQFLYGAQVVQPDHVQADVAPWERTKTFRDMPQTAESKMQLVHERRHLPGVEIDSWGGGVAAGHHGHNDQLAATPGKCCANYVELSDYA